MPKKKTRDIRSPHHPHDRYARNILQNRELATGLIRLSLPAHILETIDLDSLTPGKESFVDEQMAGHFLDVCYTGQLKDGERLRVNILFEHKSTNPDTPVYHQLLRYIVQINSHELQQRKAPPVVIPILLYQGDKPFRKELAKDIYGHYGSDYLRFVPHFDYFVTDVNNMTTREYAILVSKLTYLFIEALLCGRNPSLIPEKWEEILIFVTENNTSDAGVHLFKCTALYFASVSDNFKTRLHNNMAYEAETPFEKFVEETFTKENIPYIRQRIADVNKLREERAKGIAEGTAKGIAEGTAKGKLEGKLEGRELTISTFLSKMPDMPDAEVARLFDVTPEYIRNLRKKLNKV